MVKATDTAAQLAAEEAATDTAQEAPVQETPATKGVQVSAVIPKETFDKANKLRFKLEIENRGDLLRRAVEDFVAANEHLLTDAS